MTQYGQRLERLGRYVARPPIATERLSLTCDGRLLYRLRRPFADGTEALLFDPLVFLERLAALIPRPRFPTITYHGVLAPAASWRDHIVPDSPRARRQRAANSHATEPAREEARDDVEDEPTRRRYSWPELMRRVFEFDVLRCPCGARRKILAAITDPSAIAAILDCLALPTEPPLLAPARAPPQLPLPFSL